MTTTATTTDIDRILRMSARELHALLEAGHPIDPAALDDTEYRGISLGLWGWVEKLSWKTFMKTFHRDPETGRLRGWNVRMKQNGLEGPFEPMEDKGVPKTFGHYEVVACDAYRVPKGCEHGLLIHYGLGEKNASVDPVRRVRDPLVALEPGSAELLLGWSYVDTGISLVSTPSYFLLERHGPLTHIA
jgi:hypothetical protein